jgi:hypothetical protein
MSVNSTRCARCGGSNVDYEGYCWTCEEHNEAGGTPPPPWMVAPRDPFADLPPLPPQRSRSNRIATLLLPPALTFLLIVCGVGAFYGFEAADTFMTAPPPSLAPIGSGAPPTAAAAGSAAPPAVASRLALEKCVVGAWRHTSLDLNIDGDGTTKIHATGRGGTIVFSSDGTGTVDFTGRVVTGTLSGKAYTFSSTGTAHFTYSIVDGAGVFHFNPDRVPMSVTGGGVNSTNTYYLPDDRVFLTCGGDSLTMSDDHGTIVSARTS